MSKLIFSPDVDGWNTGSHLADAVAAAGMDLSEMNQIIERDGPRLEAALAANRASQLASGHWGAPLFVFEDEIFFGQDRIDDLVWHLQNNGLTTR